jgi:hypothetical protein
MAPGEEQSLWFLRTIFKFLGIPEIDPRNRFRQAGNRFLGSFKGFQIQALAGLYDNPISTQFLAPIECYKFQHWPSTFNFLKV